MVAALPLIDLVYRRGKFLSGHTDERDLFFLVLALTGIVVGAGALRARILCGGRHADADGGGQP